MMALIKPFVWMSFRRKRLKVASTFESVIFGTATYNRSKLDEADD